MVGNFKIIQKNTKSSLGVNKTKSGFISNNSAFTIVELLVVIVIIGILAAITIVSYSNVSQKAMNAAIQSDLTNSVKK